MRQLEEKLQYHYKDRALLETALTHSSYANERKDSSRESNERLEFLGDSVLGVVVAEHLFLHYPDMPEGQMTRQRAELVCEHSLVQVARALDLGAYLRLGRGEEHTGGRSRPSILADCVEAVIASLYLDGGFAVAKAFIEKHILANLGKDTPQGSSDYKTELQELIQRKSGQSLSYQLLSESGPDHCKVFTAQVCLNGEPVGRGSGRTKKEAEQAAACCALEALRS